MLRFAQVSRSSEPAFTEDGTFQGSMAFMLERHSTEVTLGVDVTTFKLTAGFSLVPHEVVAEFSE